MRKLMLLCVVALGPGLTAQAQTKISASSQCNKPDQQSALDVGDKPGHTFLIAKQACTWTKAIEIAGASDKTYESTIFSEVTATKSHDHGFVVDTWSSGDKSYVRWQGTATLKDGKAESQEGTWSFVGGTGKLKGIQGKGAYKCTPAGDGATCEVEGEYMLAK
ncbi:MAG TPA: hypothetical protein VEJ47_21550 [Candidatus Eremiobacteraceae bacterium]|nr:hypothetical protein [Candidatus Eremiobacteraceae bacterium]